MHLQRQSGVQVQRQEHIFAKPGIIIIHAALNVDFAQLTVALVVFFLLLHPFCPLGQEAEA